MEFAIKNRETKQYESFEFSDKEVVQTISKSTVNLMAKLEDNEYSKYSSIKTGNVVTKIELPSDVKLKLTSSQPFSYTVLGEHFDYFNKRKINDFLYEIDYGNIDYDYAKDYFTQQLPFEGGFCSSIRNGKYFGRNFDWTYSNKVTFVAHTPKSEKRNGVLGVCGNIPGMDKGEVDNDTVEVEGYNMFKILPFYLLDGVNDKGLFVNNNVVPLDNQNPEEMTKEIPAEVEEREKINGIMLPRYILDNFTTAYSAIDYIRKYVTIYFPESLLKLKDQLHFMVGDLNSTYVVEFFNKKMVVTSAKRMTNFYLYGVKFNKDEKVYTPEDVELDEANKPTVKNNITEYGAGLERWNLIDDLYSKASTKKGMRNLLDEIRYTRAYKGTGYEPEKYWYSEIVGAHTDAWFELSPEQQEQEKDNPEYLITVDTKPSNSTKVVEIMQQKFEERTRESGDTWITSHASVYDISAKKLYLKVQEEPCEYEFSN